MIALIVIVLIKRHRRISNGIDITLKSYTVKRANEESNHECIFPNPTYQDVKVVDKTTDVSPNPTFQDVQDDD